MNHESIGRAGEFLVAHHLEMAGLRTVHADVIGQDLWVRTVSNRMVTVQVKSTAKAIEQDGRFYYTFYNGTHIWRADVYAFVAIDVGLVIFEPTMLKRRKIQHHEFTRERMQFSIGQFFY
jgi:hypothetical protein